MRNLDQEVPDTREGPIYLVDYPVDDPGRSRARAAYLEAMERGFLFSSYTVTASWDGLADEELLRLFDLRATS
jgi:hypothetical protein